jgi:PTH2 family peptidyl-tRNA hydrolase
MAAPLDRTSPTTAAYVIATAIVAGVTGFFIGQGASLGLFREKQGWPNGYDVKVHKDSSDEENDGEDSGDDESDEEEEGNGEELASFKENEEEVKLVLVVRTDLGMTKGMCSRKKKESEPHREIRNID